MTDIPLSFTERIKKPPIASRRFLPDGPWVMALDNQLLVCTSRSKDVTDYLLNDMPPPRVANLRRVANLLDPGVDSAGGDLTPVGQEQNVEILHVDPPPGKDIFDVVHALRLDPLIGEPHKVSPNHILIPASEDHSCPFGPPEPYEPSAEDTLPQIDTDTRRVIVIDSGYQWETAWGTNPLDVYAGTLAHREAERLLDRGGWGDGKWDVGTRDVPDAIYPGVLTALSGHANFIAGVIAKHSQHAQITVLSHNGAFAEEAADLPTEAHVLRSLCRCRGQADVINLGFAFAALDGIASCAWELAFAQIGEGAVGAGPVVVAPVGNQNSPCPRYPAALDYPNVIGVGSTTALLGSEHFSNHGPWVTCSADGAHVRSTFLNVNLRVEERPRPGSPLVGDWENGKQFHFASGWATWSGTSFAAPKVVGEIVNVMVEQGCSALAAWNSLTGTTTPDPEEKLGYMFNF